MRPVRENKASVYEGRERGESISLFAINFSRRTDKEERWMKAGWRGKERQEDWRGKEQEKQRCEGQTRNEK